MPKQRPVLRQLASSLDRAGRDESVKVVVLTGKGKFFCTGADLSGWKEGGEGAKLSETVYDYLVNIFGAVVSKIKSLNKLVPF